MRARQCGGSQAICWEVRTEDGADAHIDKMAKKYLNLESYPYRNPAEQRVIYTIQADQVQVSG